MFTEDISKYGQTTVHWGGWWTQKADGKVDRAILGICDLEVEHREGRNHGNADGLSWRLRDNWRRDWTQWVERGMFGPARPSGGWQRKEQSQWWGLSLWRLHNTLFPKGRMEVTVRVLRLLVIYIVQHEAVIRLGELSAERPPVGNHQKGKSYVKCYWTQWSTLALRDGALFRKLE